MYVRDASRACVVLSDRSRDSTTLSPETRLTAPQGSPTSLLSGGLRPLFFAVLHNSMKSKGCYARDVSGPLSQNMPGMSRARSRVNNARSMHELKKSWRCGNSLSSSQPSRRQLELGAARSVPPESRLPSVPSSLCRSWVSSRALTTMHSNPSIRF